MNVALDSAEHVLVRQVAEVVAEEIREQVVRDLSQNPVLWSKRTAAYMIGGEQDHSSVRYVEDLIADGEFETFKSGRNGGTSQLPDSLSRRSFSCTKRMKSAILLIASSDSSLPVDRRARDASFMTSSRSASMDDWPGSSSCSSP